MTREGRALSWMLAYVVVVGSALLAWNAIGGGMIQDWYAEYVGADGRLSGSGAWRGDEHAAFQMFALVLGTWVYPLCVIVTFGFVRRAWRAESAARRARCVGAIVVALGMLACFASLGVFRAVAEL